jgi:hypothetical protein
MRIATLMFLVSTQSFAQGPVAKPVIACSQTHHDFGKINHDEKISFRFTAKNAGSANLHITGLYPSCGCTTSQLAKPLLEPNETTQIEITFDPRDYRGHVSKGLQVASNDPSTPLASLSFEADILRDIIPSTSTLFFHDLLRTRTEQTTLKLQSDNGRPIEVTEIKAGAPFLNTTLSKDGNDAIIQVVFDPRRMVTYQSSGQVELTIGTTHPHFRQIPIFVQWAFKPFIASNPVRAAWVDKAEHPHRGSVVLSHLNGKPFRILQVTPSRDDIVVEGMGQQAAASHSLRILFKTKTAGSYDETVTFLLDDPDQPEFKLGLAAVLE